MRKAFLILAMSTFGLALAALPAAAADRDQMVGYWSFEDNCQNDSGFYLDKSGRISACFDCSRDHFGVWTFEKDVLTLYFLANEEARARLKPQELFLTDPYTVTKFGGERMTLVRPDKTRYPVLRCRK